MRQFLQDVPDAPFWQKLGIGYYFAWIFIVVNNPAVLLGDAGVGLSLNLVGMLLSSTLIVWLIVLMLCDRLIAFSARNKVALLFVSLASSIGTVLFASSSHLGGGSSGALVAAVVIIGLGNAGLVLSWGRFWNEVDSGLMGAHLVVSLVFSFVFSALLLNLPLYVLVAITTVLPLFSGGTLYLCRFAPKKRPRPQEQSNNKSFVAKMLIASVTVTVGFSLLRSMSRTSGAIEQDARFLAGAAACVALVVALMVILAQKGPLIIRIYRITFPIVIVAFSSLSVLPESCWWIAYAAILCGRRLIDALIWLVYPEIKFSSGRASFSLFGWATVCLHAGSLLGAILGFLLAEAQLVNTVRAVIAIGSLSAILLTLIMSFVFKEYDLNSLLGVDRKIVLYESMGERCQRIAFDYGLSAREREVFELLVNGRSIRYIADELVITPATVKTHVRHIYEKLGVHHRQEIHDLVEKGSGNSE